MGRPKKTEPAAAPLATTKPGELFRSQAFTKAREIAIDEYNTARNLQQSAREHFAEQYGRTDRMDRAYADDIRRLLIRTTAIARTKAGNDHTSSTKVAKLATMLAEMLGHVELTLATDFTQELFTPVDQAEYLGGNRYQGVTIKDEPDQWVGERAAKAAEFLAATTIVNDPKGKIVTPAPSTELTRHDQTRAASAAREREYQERAADLARAADADDQQCTHEQREVLPSDERFGNEDLDGNEYLFTHGCLMCSLVVGKVGAVWMDERQFEAVQLAEEEHREAARMEQNETEIPAATDGRAKRPAARTSAAA